ncbi:hypothetical protein BpHYR1_010942 [Brachionus plicatilis]|uniref:Uncharacterized protein n=1 Tax=Brachionus plicatilis TaxID=10195 RepID=A0A3M7P7Q3_BRAPC|nr:hypothetical protein BpHYR1_010942 [Brachionus plicatilis]
MMVKPAAPSYDKTRTKTRRSMYPLIEDHIVWLPPPSSFLILGLGPAYGKVMVAYNTKFKIDIWLENIRAIIIWQRTQCSSRHSKNN